MTRTVYPPLLSEDAIHRTLVRMLELLERIQPGAPFTFWHIPNGGNRSKAEGGKMKALGTRAGMPDLEFLVAGTTYFIELKDAKGRLSPEQKNTIERLERAGGRVEVCRSVEDVMPLLVEWNILPADHLPRFAFSTPNTPPMAA